MLNYYYRSCPIIQHVTRTLIQLATVYRYGYCYEYLAGGAECKVRFVRFVTINCQLTLIGFKQCGAKNLRHILEGYDITRAAMLFFPPSQQTHPCD